MFNSIEWFSDLYFLPLSLPFDTVAVAADVVAFLITIIPSTICRFVCVFGYYLRKSKVMSLDKRQGNCFSLARVKQSIRPCVRFCELHNTFIYIFIVSIL